MNILLSVLRVIPPVLVVALYVSSHFLYAGEDAQKNQRLIEGESDEGAAANAAVFKRYDLGNGRTLVLNSAKAFEAYDNWIVDPGSFTLSKRQRELGKKSRKRLQAMLIDARVKQTRSFGGTVVNAVSPCTLKQRLKLEELRLNSNRGGGSQVSFMRSFGSARIVAEISDSQTDEILFRYSEDIALGGGVTGASGPNINRLAKAIKVVMANAHAILVKALPLREERIASRATFGCAGQLGKNAISLRAEHDATR